MGNGEQGTLGRRPRVLFLANGHGEDHMAAQIIDRLPPNGPLVSAWAMVGRGEAFERRGAKGVGHPNILPSCGFATLSLALMCKDLKAGWISTHVGQVRAARGLKGQFDLGVAVGDVVPMAAAVLAGLPFVFAGCAKSAYYSFHYTAFEKFLLRRFCLLAFPRDRPTETVLKKAGVPTLYAGIPMMDDLAPSGLPLDIPPGSAVLGLLPGSRHDDIANTLRLLDVTAKAMELAGPARPLIGLVAAHPGFDTLAAVKAVRKVSGLSGWMVERAQGPMSLAETRLAHPRTGARAIILKNRFSDVLHASEIVVGLAGTANEQAVGLGKPLVTFPVPGHFGENYVKMKMELFGDSAVRAKGPADAAAQAVRLMADPGLCRRMGETGRQRMGGPGASRVIADTIMDLLGPKRSRAGS